MSQIRGIREEKRSVVAEKSFLSSIRIVEACKVLRRDRSEFVLSRQLLRSGTSIGANIEEALGGYSRADFAAKIGISYKEARESVYWIRLLGATDYFTRQECESLKKDAFELVRMLASIRLSLRSAGSPIPPIDS